MNAPVPSPDELRRLRTAAAAWVADVCRALETDPPQGRRAVVVSASLTGYETRDVRTVDLSAVERLSRELDLSSFDGVSEIAIERRDVFPLVPPADNETGTQRMWAAVALGEPILHAYLERAGRVHFDAAQFDAVFDDLERELQSQATPYTALAGIALLDLPDGSVELPPGVLLRPRTNADLEDWVNRRVAHAGLGYTGVDAVLEWPYVEKRDELLGARHTQDLVHGIVRAIQLQCDCDAHATFVHFRREATFYAGLAGVVGGAPRFSRRRGALRAQDAAAVGALYRQLSASPNLLACQIALDRWNSLTAGGSPQAVIVDAWVGLESLLLRDKSSEITFRVSLRLAALIGRDGDERREIFAGAKKAYGGRSTVLHGADASKLDLPALAAQSREYLRRALIAVLMLDIPFDPNAIDERLLS